jgi:hypothetical protein
LWDQGQSHFQALLGPAQFQTLLDNINATVDAAQTK